MESTRKKSKQFFLHRLFISEHSRNDLLVHMHQRGKGSSQWALQFSYAYKDEWRVGRGGSGGGGGGGGSVLRYQDKHKETFNIYLTSKQLMITGDA